MAVAAATQAPQDFAHTPGAPGHEVASEADCDVSAVLDWRMMHRGRLSSHETHVFHAF